MDSDTIPLGSLSADLGTALRDCINAGRRLIVELPDRSRIALEPLSAADDDDQEDTFMDDLIASNAEFRQRFARSDATTCKPLELDTNRYGDSPPLADGPR